MRIHRSIVGLGFACLLAAADARAAPPSPVALGEVTTEVARQDVDLGAVLRAVVEQELPAIDLGRYKPKPSILSVSLTQMQRVSGAGSKAAVTVVVSATLRDKRHGAVIALLEGRARAENDERLVQLLERAALKSAVRGALARLPEALDAQQR